MAERTVKREQLEPTAGFRRAMNAAWLVGGVGLIVSILLGRLADPSMKRFYFAYLISYAFCLSISLGALFFVLLQHLTRAGWSVGIRRTAETLAAAMPVLVVLSAPIVLSVIVGKGELYPWVHSAPPAEAGSAKVVHGYFYLNPAFFLVRMVVCFVFWSVVGVWFRRRSVEQDATGDPSLTLRMQAVAAPAMVGLAITLTLAAVDLFMSLDPSWFSTMFGVYFFSGCAVAIFATLIVIIAVLQAAGYLTQSITQEHFHDLGKFLFAFTFFWGYIAFSQYMLIWYANIPEETAWMVRHGASSAVPNAWSSVLTLLLIGHLLIPFAGLLSRHVKRSRPILIFWAAWLLVFHWLDLYWVVMPQLDGKVHFGAVDLACLVGVGGIYIAMLVKIAMDNDLRPVGDPRLVESLTFENI